MLLWELFRMNVKRFLIEELVSFTSEKAETSWM